MNHQLLKVGKGLRVGITLLTDEGRQRTVHRSAVLLHGKAEGGGGGRGEKGENMKDDHIW